MRLQSDVRGTALTGGWTEAGDLLLGGLTHLIGGKFVPAVSWGSCFLTTGCLSNLCMAPWWLPPGQIIQEARQNLQGLS